MEIPASLRVLFTGEIEARDDEYTIDVPTREVELGALNTGESYRIAVLKEPIDDERHSSNSTTTHGDESQETPPVTEGDRIEVEIETLGDQGDGIAYVGPGYVVIVEDTSVGDRVTAEITTARENVAFAEVVER